jgi:amino acid adenylation domain-containing protein
MSTLSKEGKRMVYLLSQIIDRSAEKFPERRAFRIYGEEISYSELSVRSNQLARTLARQGVRRRDRVGIFMNKCLEMPISVHGIMKAGAAYVPIDPAAPAARLKYIIHHCGIRVLITQTSKINILSETIRETDLACLIGIDAVPDLDIRTASWQEVNDASIHQLDKGPTTEMDLAYIMYTSGSTGEPKGIMHTHHSGLSYAKLSAETFELCEKDILGNHSPLHFDMSTFEFFSGPLKGACTILIPEEYTKLPASLSNLIAEEHLTIWYSVPFALIQLLLRGAMETRDLSDLRWILFGGEPFPINYLRELMIRLPNARFSNVYGPAEVNQCAFYHVSKPPEKTEVSIPIGQIWANCEGLVIDSHDQPVDPGKTGELLIRSPTMMQGYWNREDLNQRAFYFRRPLPGYKETFYRTGDLVKLTQKGNYKYIGRKDRQIKTRGYRVELDEIEMALLSQKQVEEAAVFSIPDSEGSTLISAGVTLKDNQKVTESELMKYLKTKLPWYAVPRKIDIVKKFPRTSSGKIDRRALKHQAIKMS